MANAMYVDALKGYEYYLKKGGKLKLDEINDYLIRERRNPIAHRTYRHFHKLLVHGFRGYVPINKFDVIASLNQLQAAADRRRYHREPTTVAVQVSRDGINWVNALTVDKSLVGFGIISKEPFQVKSLALGYLRIDGYKIIPIVFVWRKHIENTTRLGVRAPEFITNYRLGPDEIAAERLGGSIIISRDREGPIEWTSLYTALVKTNELLKGVTDLLYALEDVLDADISFAHPVLKSIQFSSPGNFEITTDKAVSMVLDILTGLFDRIINFGLYKRKLRAEVQNLELDNANKKVELVRNTFNLGKEIRDSDITGQAASALLAIIPYLFDVNKPSSKEIFAADSPEIAILKNRIIPAAEELLAGDDPEYKIQIKPPSKKRNKS